MTEISCNKQAGAISPKLTLSLLGVMFLIPLTVAWLMYSGAIDYRPGTSVNRGTLIEPPVVTELPEQFSASDLDEHWVLTHFLPENCGEDCRTLLYGLRQVHRALGRDAARIRILLLASDVPEDELLKEFVKPDGAFTVITTNTVKLSQQFELLGDKNGIFIIDPLGNIMMRYDSETDPNDLLFDMERLLQYQKTDPQ